MSLQNLILIVSMFLYMIIIVIYIRKKQRLDEVNDMFDFYEKANKQVTKIPIEKKLLNAMHINNDKSAKKIIVLFRLFVFLGFVYLVYKFGTLALIAISGIFITSYLNRKNEQLIDNSGIRYIPITNEFLDIFVPAISSGKSNDQAMVMFIRQHENNEVLNYWWINKETQTMKDPRYKNIVEIYDMVIQDEKLGISDSLPVINEMHRNINKKQEYYNDFIAKMGETKSIELSYIVGLPILLLVTFSRTKTFWFSLPGLFASIILCVLFLLFKFLTYRLKKKTIEVLF